MSEGLHVIVGLGVTALSCARFLKKQNIPLAFADTRAEPPNLARILADYPNCQVSLGKLDDKLLDSAAKIIVSPGVSIKEPALARQIGQGKTVIGDIELFAHVVAEPVIAITGTNAKSTVTTLVGKMALMAGLRSEMGGNLGTPALDLLERNNPELFVLELSSFQLETTHSLKPQVAALLNITPDHMDRYATLKDYQDAKHRVFMNCEIAVCNRDDPATDALNHYSKQKVQFTLQTPGKQEFGLVMCEKESYLAFEDQLLMPVHDLPILGRHYQANALAALAIGHSFGLRMAPMIETLLTFNGLEHRCQLVRERNGIRWYNDSKGTNVGATLAAIEGLGPEIDGKLILIAGGVGKNADFSPLVPGVAKYVRTVILIGESAPVLADILTDRVEICFAKSMQEAVTLAEQAATPGDSVLLSPACASLDMFKNFEHRGAVFTEVVKGLT
ncbi:MAG: UDP-N-acetylmuramoyl-L-alanine--D-glutamate ligase [Pseudomonadota bacterium]